MMPLIPAFCFCGPSFFLVSLALTVEVQPGANVTLQCIHSARHAGHIAWFKQDNGSEPVCVSTMWGSQGKPLFHHGFQSHRLTMRSEKNTISLIIHQVNFSDHGLYFCGLYSDQYMVFLNATLLVVQVETESDIDKGGEDDGNYSISPLVLILEAVIAFLFMAVLTLGYKIRQLKKLLRDVNDRPQQQMNQEKDSDELNYAALSFHPKRKSNRKAAKLKVSESSVVYAATR